MIRGLALRSVKGWAAPELEVDLRARAAPLCQQLGDPPELFPVLWNVTFFNMIRGDLALVREQIADAAATGRAGRYAGLSHGGRHVAGVTAEFTGDFAESNRLLERAARTARSGRHEAYTAMFGIDPGMVARAMSSASPLGPRLPGSAHGAQAANTIALGRLAAPAGHAWSSR
jgi:hypothetical protein